MSTLKVAIDRLKLNSGLDESPAAVFSQVGMLAVLLDRLAQRDDVTRTVLRDVTALSNFSIRNLITPLVKKHIVREATEDDPEGGHARIVYSVMPVLQQASAAAHAKIKQLPGDLTHDGNMLPIISAIFKALHRTRQKEESMTLVLKQFATAIHLLYLEEQGEEIGRKALVELTQLTPAAVSLHLGVLVRKGIFDASRFPDRTQRGRPELRYSLSDKISR